MKIIAPAAVVAALCIAGPALAQDAEVAGDSVAVGAAALYLPDYEGSDDYRITPAPGIAGSVKGYNFLLAGNRASVDLIRNEPGPNWDFQLGPFASVNFTRSSIKSIEDVRVKALGKLDRAIELGGYVGIGKTGVITSDYDKLSLSVTYRKDVSGTHRSHMITPTINYLTPLSRKAAVGAFVSVDFVGSGYARTYYAVDAAQSVASGLPVYTPGGGMKSWTAGGGTMVALTGDLLHGVKLAAGGSYIRMVGDIGDAPIVSIAGSRGQWLGAVGLAYTF